MSYINKYICTTVWLLLLPVTMFAQSIVFGTVISKADGKAISDCYVLLAKDGKVVKVQATDKNGKFRIMNIADGSYMIELSCMGYTSQSDSITVKGELALNFKLVEDAVGLDEVTVTGNRNNIVKRTANGEVFFLSEKAKKEHNPFVALQDIPVLISDPTSSSVKLANGKSPMILINGNVVNSGINPISPSDIESIEVIRTASARFLQQGVEAIVNIKLKKDAGTYQWYEVATRHDIPLDKGFGVGYFEVGNPKLSLYGRTVYNYTYHDDVETITDRSNTTYHQQFEQKSSEDGHSWLGELLLKACFTPNDYFAVHAYGTMDITKQRRSAAGTYETATSLPYSSDGLSKNNSKVLTSSLYYKHSFTDANILELRLAYNYNRNDYDANQTDYYGNSPATFTSLYENSRNSGSLDIDYSLDFANGHSLTAGSNSAVQYDKINNLNIADGLFHHRSFDQYFYLGYAGNIGKDLSYNASIGIEGLWLKAGDVNNHYFRPRASGSIVWRLNNRNSLRLSHSTTNIAPTVAQLNTNNVSTDSLLVQVGNPLLTPQMKHRTELRYTLNVGNLYFEPNAYFRYDTDKIQEYGYSQVGVYTSTYQNYGNFYQWWGGANLTYRLNPGFINGEIGWLENYYDAHDGKGSIYASITFTKKIKKFTFTGFASYNTKEYSNISYTRHYKPTSASLQLTYNFTPDFYISMMVQHVTGERKTITHTNSGSFHSIVETRYKDQCFRPWVLVRYTFRKHADKKIKLGKVLDSKEKGISIIK